MQPQHPWDAGHTGPGGVGWLPDPFPGDRSSSTPPGSGRPRQSNQKDSIVGEAHYIHHRQEGHYILTFRVERYDRHGNRLQPVPVEMRGYSITGFINEGDQVRVSGSWRKGLVQAKRADNETTGAVVSVKSTPVACLILAYGFIIIFFAVILGSIILGVIFSR